MSTASPLLLRWIVIPCCLLCLPRVAEAQDSRRCSGDAELAVELGNIVHAPAFIANSGQWPAQLRYMARLERGYVLFMRDRIVFQRLGDRVAREMDTPDERADFAETLLSARRNRSGRAGGAGANALIETSVVVYPDAEREASPMAVGRRPATINVFRGASDDRRPTRWETFDTLIYPSPADGYDLRVTHDNRRLHWSIVPSAPAARHSMLDMPPKLAAIVDACERTTGTLLASVRKRSVSSGDMVYSTVFGAGRTDIISRIIPVRDDVYILCGTTRSPDFPVTDGAYDTEFRGDTSSIYGTHLFISCVDIGKRALLFSTFFGGVDRETLMAAERSANGDIVFAGYTWSDDLPTTAGAYQPRYRGNGDGYVAALDGSGSRLLFCTYLGGSGIENLHDMKLDNEGNIVLSGLTDSRDFPTTPGVLQRVYGGGDDDMFVAKLSGDGSRLLFGTYIGGAGWDEGYNLQLLGARGILVSGATNSDNFPVTADALYPRRLGYDEGCLLILDNNARGLVYSTYIAWDAHENVWDAQLDDSDVFTLFGITTSTNLPTTESSFQRRKGGYPVYNQLSADYYLLRFRLGATEPLACTYIGGSGSDRYAVAFVVLPGNSYAIGGTSLSHDYPVTKTIFPDSTGEFSPVVSILDSSLGTLKYGFRLGGRESAGLRDLARKQGLLLLCGYTQSEDFQVTPDAWQVAEYGKFYGFFSIFDISSIVTSAPSPLPAHPIDELRSAYPDPAPRHATVTFLLSGPGRARVTIHDLLGRTLHTVVDAALPAGEHARGISTAGMPGGVYILRLHTERGTHTKMLRVAGG